MSKFSDFLARVYVVLNAAPLYLTGAAVAVAAISEEISKAFPDSASPVVQIAAPILAGLAAAIAIIRRVTPVRPADRGLLVSPDNVTQVKSSEKVITVVIPEERISDE